MIYDSYSQEETMKIASDIARQAKAGQIFSLSGDLGTGKTVFSKGFAKGLGIEEMVTSPTFTIINEYNSGTIPMYHFDVYRVTDESEMEDTGYEDYFYGQGVCLVEWAELISELMPKETIWISIEKDLEKGLDYRKIKVGKETEQ